MVLLLALLYADGVLLPLRALNRSVLRMLPQGSVWRNYFLAGGIWTTSSKPALPAISPLQANTNEIGALFLANATMETFTQYPNPAPATWSGPVNCFTCHNTPASGLPPFKVSHAVGKLLGTCPYDKQLPAACANTQKPAGH
jgi:hypothetical protein